MPEKKKAWRQVFVDWVNGDLPDSDPTTQYVMQRRPPLPPLPPEFHDALERRRLKKFLNLYPVAAGLLCLVLTVILLATAVAIPPFGQPGNPTNNEVSQHYLEYTEVETGAINAVTGIILSYRGFDTLGESCVLFLAASCVMMLLQQDVNNTNATDLRRRQREDGVARTHPDNILQKTAAALTPFLLLFALYVLLNGETSPGGGFSGGAILSGALILCSSAFGPKQIGRVFTQQRFNRMRIAGLVLYTAVYGFYIFTGANALHLDMEWMMLLIDLAVGLVVACTIYGFYAMFQRGVI